MSRSGRDVICGMREGEGSEMRRGQREISARCMIEFAETQNLSEYARDAIAMHSQEHRQGRSLAGSGCDNQGI